MPDARGERVMKCSHTLAGAPVSKRTLAADQALVVSRHSCSTMRWSPDTTRARSQLECVKVRARTGIRKKLNAPTRSETSRALTHPLASQIPCMGWIAGVADQVPRSGQKCTYSQCLPTHCAPRIGWSVQAAVFAEAELRARQTAAQARAVGSLELASGDRAPQGREALSEEVERGENRRVRHRFARQPPAIMGARPASPKRAQSTKRCAISGCSAIRGDAGRAFQESEDSRLR